MTPLPFLIQNLLEERERWFLWIPVGIGAGIALYFALPFEPSRFLMVLTPLLIALAVGLRRHPAALVAFSALLCFALGFNAAQLEAALVEAPMLERQMGPVAVTGRLMLTEVMPDGTRLTLKDPTIGRLPPDKTPDLIRIKTKMPLDKIPEPGSRLDLWAEVGPFSDPVAPGGYDFRRQAFFRHIGGVGWSYGEARLAEASPPTGLWDRFNLLFERARRALTRHVDDRLTGDTAAMTAALLNGEQTSIGKDVMQAMRASGLAHLLSISGVHVSMMGVLVYFPLRALLALIPWVALRFSIKKWAAWAAIVATSLYTMLVGPQTPTLRSALMTGIVMFAIIADRRAMSLRLVTLSAAVVMLIAPDGVVGPSFQMSFAAVLGMVAAFEKPLDAALRERTLLDLPGWIATLWKHAGSIVLTSLVATAATTPFTLYHFQTFSFYGVVANMVAIPLTSFWIMPCLLLVYLTAPFGLDGWFLSGAGWGVDALIALAQRVAAWPYALLRLPAMPDGALIAIILGGLWLCLWQRRWRYAGLLPILIGMLYPLYVTTPDVFMTADGKQWGVKLGDGRLAVATLRREAFVTAQWQQRLGLSPDEVVEAGAALPPLATEDRDGDETETEGSEHEESLHQAALPPALEGDGTVRCDGMGCVYRRGGQVVAFPALAAAVLEDCEMATILLAPWRVKDCATPIVIDEPPLWRHGAYALAFKENGTADITFVRPQRGQRPWSPQ